MNSTDLTFRIGRDTRDRWPELVRQASEQGQPITVTASSQTVSFNGFTGSVVFASPSQALALDLPVDAGIDETIWAAAFPRLKAFGAAQLDGSIAADLSAPRSIGSFLVEIARAGHAIEVSPVEGLSIDIEAATIPLADDGAPFDEALSEQLAGIVGGAALAGLRLANGEDEASHRVSQASEGQPDLDYWHGLMHRREPDYGNASYWFRRVGDHAAFATLFDAVCHTLTEFGIPTEDLEDLSPWNPFEMIDRCRVASGRSASTHDEEVFRVLIIQQIEYRHLLTQQLG